MVVFSDRSYHDALKTAEWVNRIMHAVMETPAFEQRWRHSSGRDRMLKLLDKWATTGGRRVNEPSAPSGGP